MSEFVVVECPKHGMEFPEKECFACEEYNHTLKSCGYNKSPKEGVRMIKRRFQCESRTCRLDMNDDSFHGCVVEVPENHVAIPIVCPLYEGKVIQTFVELK